MTPTAADLIAALDATWPAASFLSQGGWLLRQGLGGGQRVSAATWKAPNSPGPGRADIAVAEAAMAALDQPPLFMIRDGDGPLDQALAAAGYRRHDPVALYLGATAALADPAPEPLAAFALWPPLAIVRDIWAEAGIGPARLAVMHRAAGPKTAILGRTGPRAAGAAFVALHGQMAMLHALEVRPALRRQGTAGHIMRHAAAWARDQGAAWLSLAVLASNDAARILYASLGMSVVGHYHYRQK